MESLPHQLLDCLQRFKVAHKYAEQCYAAHVDLDRQLTAVRKHIRANATGSNQAKRDLEELEILNQKWSDLVKREHNAERLKHDAEAERDRAHEELKTLRALLAHETALLESEAASAGTMRVLHR